MAAYSGLYNGVHGEDYALLANQQPHENKINKLFRGSRYGMRELKELLLTTIGASAGSAAADTYKRIEAQVGNEDFLATGGVVPIETVTVIGRNTTAADVTALKAMLTRISAPTTYPADKSGNGGGAPTTLIG